ncbi:hypothetical protein PRIPAC_75309 [Pristionchus pacificus]|uniref:Uncharacterized protein n=1 Tax=Pristionchus pacificus TaxID=54126 RepID=A0A2A6BES8_PRIPA|nr:hypothetical protein PRIPAC_75309 [Pristionchus pacificus]|eukprot:PDM64382.1 hypothetical protein PRIPAC_52638 [Pristionchus pacificus]
MAALTATMSDSQHDWAWDLAVGGVNYSIPGNGGPECRSFIPYWQRLVESSFFVPSACVLVWRLLPQLSIEYNERPLKVSRYWVLTLYSLVFGAELAFKMISKTGIFLLNPCHVATVIQLALLSMDSEQPLTCLLFRLQMYIMPGAILALVFPILNTRLLPGEVLIYYLQHIFIILIPLYLMYIRGAFQPEQWNDMSWPAVSLLLIVIYHFGPLTALALYSNVNLNNILCPAVSDPFGTRFYHLFACVHQTLFVPLVAKSYAFIGSKAIDVYSTLFVPAPPQEENCKKRE